MSGRWGPVRRALGAAAAFSVIALTAFFYYYLTHIPIARTPGAQERLSAVVGRELLLDGLGPGIAFTLNVRGAQRVQLDLTGGARLVEPSAQDLADYPLLSGGEPGLADRKSLLILPRPGGNAQIDFEVQGDAPALVLRPDEPVGDARAFGLTSWHGRLIVRVALSAAEGASLPGQMIYRTAHEVRSIDELALELPAGDRLDFTIHAPPVQEPGPPVLVQLPMPPPASAGLSELEVGSVAVGQRDGDHFAVDAIACAAPQGRSHLWRSPFPSIALGLCRPRGLRVDRLDPLAQQDQIALVSGQMFRTSDAGTEYWTGPSNFFGNFVISGLAGALLTLLLGWGGATAKKLVGGSRRRRFARDDRNGSK
jgi:hypothetical protein